MDLIDREKALGCFWAYEDGDETEMPAYDRLQALPIVAEVEDCISRQDAIRWVKTECNPYGKPTLEFESGKKVIEHLKQMPSAQPERLTDDDFETIRIHLNAYKENLCNQHRWEEAEEYQHIIDRFMAFASTQAEIIHCKDCVYWDSLPSSLLTPEYHECVERPFHINTTAEDFCSRAERRQK